mgnify:CR=1 FL=1
MDEERNICDLIEEDIAYAETVWKTSAYDLDVLEKLFYRLIERYKERIAGFSKGLQVMQSYETPPVLAEIYRENISLLVERLKGFRENQYSNEGLTEYYIRRDWQEMHLDMDFTTVRLELGMMGLAATELEEIAEHLNDMEAICARVITQKEKWEGMRQHLFWLSGKEVGIAVKLLPLFFKINEGGGIYD